jgi:hypothetical protein
MWRENQALDEGNQANPKKTALKRSHKRGFSILRPDRNQNSPNAPKTIKAKEAKLPKNVADMHWSTDSFLSRQMSVLARQ